MRAERAAMLLMVASVIGMLLGVIWNTSTKLKAREKRYASVQIGKVEIVPTGSERK